MIGARKKWHDSLIGGTIAKTLDPEPLDPTIYESWDFERINREARRLRELERDRGRDAVVSSRRGRATAVGRKRGT